MFKFFRNQNKAVVKRNSKNNIICQDSNIGSVNVFTNYDTVISAFASQGNYEAIQQMAKPLFESISKAHPLYPHYIANYNQKLDRFVSTPQTEEALKKYPKKIQGKFLIEQSKFPHMRENENPFSYAYRTQTTLELPTTDIKEYIGEHEDPFPTVTKDDKVFAVIKPPSFPEGGVVRLCSGNMSIPVFIRRQPCLEYGKILLRSDSGKNDIGLDLIIIISDNFNKTTFTVEKINSCSLQAHLEREKLIEQIFLTKSIKIKYQQHTIMQTTISEVNLNLPFFKQAHSLCIFLQNLISIQNYFNCDFDALGDVMIEDYEYAELIRSSIEKKWLLKDKLTFDTSRANYDNINPELLESENGEFQCISQTIDDIEISLQGVTFKGRLTVYYCDVKINNFNSVRKHIKKHRNNILITYRPANGLDHFLEYSRLEDISIVKND